MADLETQDHSSCSVMIFVGLFFGIVVGFGLGIAYQSYKDKTATNILDNVISTYKTMQEAASFPSYKGEEMTQRLNVLDTEAGIGYIDIHYIPRASLPKLKGENKQ